MTQDRLSALDASFLYLDSPCTPMHISSLAIYEGPTPRPRELISLLERRLPLVPRFRQRLERVPFGAHRPVWVTDDRFNLEAHLNQVALPWPGGDAELQMLAGRILSQPLCRSRPLWEMWLIEGLSDGRFAVLAKTHHSLWDGITGADLHSVLLDLEADPPPGPELTFEPTDPPPTRAQLWTEAIRDRIGEAAGATGGILRSLRSPRRALRSAAEISSGTAALTASLLRPAPPCSLNGKVGSARRFAITRSSFADLRSLKDRYGTTVNDAILAAVAGGLRRWQIHRGLEPQDLRVMVPVSVRSGAEEGTLGNRVVMVVVPLPVSQPDPVLRLRSVHGDMELAKQSAQIPASDALLRLSAFLPPQAMAAMSWAQSALRSFNLLVTNVPGPQFPLYLCGRRLLELFPQAPLATNQAVSVACMSYDGRLGFGLLADHAIVADVEVLAEGLEDSIAELSQLMQDEEELLIPKPVAVPVGAGFV